MSYVIDLDQVIADAPVVQFGGEEYQVADVPVKKMLELARLAEDAEGNEAVWINLQEQIKVLVPDAPQEFYDSLGIRQTSVLINGILGDVDLGEGANAKQYIRRRKADK